MNMKRKGLQKRVLQERENEGVVLPDFGAKAGGFCMNVKTKGLKVFVLTLLRDCGENGLASEEKWGSNVRNELSYTRQSSTKRIPSK
jgi:hypothetical protein